MSRQKKMGRASNLSQDIFPYCLTILHTFDSGMPIRSIGISLSNTSQLVIEIVLQINFTLIEALHTNK
ncbi:DinB/UmuC family translesion DNA polymerase [Priestia megaterium]|uniref:DinB/UmuC family translesion DNA polymerase n=1 Tax=Priestia megaterium TaxID=1404 RepID=UPI00355C0F5E